MIFLAFHFISSLSKSNCREIRNPSLKIIRRVQLYNTFMIQSFFKYTPVVLVNECMEKRNWKKKMSTSGPILTISMSNECRKPAVLVFLPWLIQVCVGLLFYKSPVQLYSIDYFQWRISDFSAIRFWQWRYEMKC